MKKIIKNSISVISFIVLIVIFAYKFQLKVDKIAEAKNNINKQNMALIEQTKREENDKIATTSEVCEFCDDINAKQSKINYVQFTTPVSEEEKEFEAKRKEFYDEINANGNANHFYDENKNYIFNLLEGKKFLGDSNVYCLETYNVLPFKYYDAMKGTSTTEQYPLIDKFIDLETNNYIFWNGYNIKYFKDADDFVCSYDKLVEKIKSINPNARVFICSLLPATDERIEKDINEGSPHNIYKGIEYDKSLEEHFKDDYIDTKKIMIGERHVGDGVHFDDVYCKMFVCYVAFEINIKNRTKTNSAVSLKNYLTSSTSNLVREDSIATSNTVEKADNENDDIFGIDNIDSKIKYRYENLELIYQCEKYKKMWKDNDLLSYYNENKNDWIKFLEGKKFCGDSYSERVQYLDVLPEDYVFAMPGKSVTEQYRMIDKFDFNSCDTLILWNGYVIKEFNNLEKYIESYEKLIKKIKEKNPEINIYVCSLLPTTKWKLEKDINEGSPHDIYKGEEYDNALKKHFSDKYIDIKFLVDEKYYSADGFHLNDVYYKSVIPYIALYLKCKDIMLHNDSNNVKDVRIATRNEAEQNAKHIYLTFDDGPTSAYTKKLLDILDKNNCKATFFVTGSDYDNKRLICEIKNKGHNIGAHTLLHDYSIYESIDSYLEDLYGIEKIIRESTGEFTNIIRFPGGSGNISSKQYCLGIMSKLTENIEDMGYSYYDWNVSSGDGANISNVQTYNNAINGTCKLKNAIVLFHETKKTTIDIIEYYVNWGKNEGYIFDVLKSDTMKCHHRVNN